MGCGSSLIEAPFQISFDTAIVTLHRGLLIEPDILRLFIGSAADLGRTVISVTKLVPIALQVEGRDGTRQLLQTSLNGLSTLGAGNALAAPGTNSSTGPAGATVLREPLSSIAIKLFPPPNMPTSYSFYSFLHS